MEFSNPCILLREWMLPVDGHNALTWGDALSHQEYRHDLHAQIMSTAPRYHRRALCFEIT